MEKFKVLKCISYNKISGWDIRQFFTKSVQFNYKSVLLNDIITPIKAVISKKEVREQGLSIISKINFSGELFLRTKDEVETYKGNLFRISEGQIIFSKINARNGCIYFHDKPFDFAVSSEYPAFVFNKSEVNGYYLWLVLRSNYAKRILKSKATGHSKARVTYKDFYELHIPLPELDVQVMLVQEYNKIVEDAKRADGKAKILENEIDSYLLNELGIEIKTKILEKGLHFVRFKTVDEWGIDFILKTKEITKGKFDTYKIGDLCKIGSGGTPSRTNKAYYNGAIPWVKTGEVLNNVIYDTEEKITEKAIKESGAKLYSAGSLIIAMYGQGLTRGRTAKLGVDATTNQACAVLYDINNDLILTDYLWIYLQNEYNRIRELASGNNQPNLNASKIFNYEIQVPSKDTQVEIIKAVSKRRQEVGLLKEQIEILKLKAKEQFEVGLFET